VGEDILSPSLHDVLERLGFGLYRFAREHVGVDERRASIRQHPRNFRLSTGDVAGQSNENHLSVIEVSLP
jgi:hypothetical protein